MLLDSSVENDQQFLLPNSQHEVFGKLPISYIAFDIIKYINLVLARNNDISF